MSRISIKDIARLAQVSTATVDRALNGRPGVSAANRQRVLKVAADHGYLPSDGMVILPSRPARLEFLVPDTGSAFMRDLAASIETASAVLPLVRSCRITRLDGIGPEHLLPALEGLSLDTQGVGVVSMDDATIRAAITDLAHAGVRVVTMASDLPDTPRHAYVGLDDHVAGQTAAELTAMALGQQVAKVAIFLGSAAYRGHEARLRGFTEYMLKNRPDLQLLPPIATGDESQVAHREARALLASANIPAAIYCIGAGRQGVAEALADINPSDRPMVVMHDLTEGTGKWLSTGLISAVIDQNAKLVGEQAVVRLLGSIVSTAPFLPPQPIEPRIILRSNLPTRPGGDG